MYRHRFPYCFARLFRSSLAILEILRTDERSIDADRSSPFTIVFYVQRGTRRIATRSQSKESSPIRSTVFSIVRLDLSRSSTQRTKRTRTRLAQRMHLPIEKYLCASTFVSRFIGRRIDQEIILQKLRIDVSFVRKNASIRHPG